MFLPQLCSFAWARFFQTKGQRREKKERIKRKRDVGLIGWDQERGRAGGEEAQYVLL